MVIGLTIWRKVMNKLMSIFVLFVLLVSSVYTDDDFCVIEGKGFRELEIGQTTEKVISILGQPDEKFDRPNTWYLYKRSLNLDVLFKDNKAIEIRFNVGFKNKLRNGIGNGSSVWDVFKEYGEPVKRVKTLSKTMLYDNMVLYEVLIDKDNKEYKIIYKDRGILFWFDSELKVSQFVVSESSNKQEKVEEKVPDASITINTIPEGGTVFIDGIKKAKSGKEIPVFKGKYTIGVALDGYEDVIGIKRVKRKGIKFTVKFRKKGISKLLNLLTGDKLESTTDNWIFDEISNVRKDLASCWSIKDGIILFKSKEGISSSFYGIRREGLDFSSNCFVVGAKIRGENMSSFGINFGRTDLWREWNPVDNKWYKFLVIVNKNEVQFFINGSWQRAKCRGGWRRNPLGILVSPEDTNKEKHAEIKDVLFIKCDENSIKDYLGKSNLDW